jgi:hypothetical protein
VKFDKSMWVIMSFLNSIISLACVRLSNGLGIVSSICLLNSYNYLFITFLAFKWPYGSKPEVSPSGTLRAY